jgi:hypothetical protein
MEHVRKIIKGRTERHTLAEVYEGEEEVFYFDVSKNVLYHII